MADPPPLTVTRALMRGMRRRCPLCGSSDLFDSYFRMKLRCPRCNLSLERVEGHWAGSLGMNIIVTLGLLLVTIGVSVALMWPQPRALPMLVPALVVAIGVPLLFFPRSRTLWSAIDLLMTPLEPDDDVDPDWIPPARRPKPRPR